MSVRSTNDTAVAMYDSVTGRAFGPIFYSTDELDAFLDWLGFDPRSVDAAVLETRYAEWKGDQT
jgi:predicted RecB family nuclease